ncbi:MAG TPA: signal peptidase II [Phycisphaerae bacterium]|nr:signal peptidase II [Phycisphaerae bacterium]HOM52222.1 signal peptidase II [Phycisphaerae bacterium]HOQ85207.1 signal peptidase II [Phycisphaerae bacterium]HPP25437.1 signal peptidase II [Phycisphaerae bacterium]HPU24739.1 signal peptidase II [Phycisphaerae bacterium]
MALDLWTKHLAFTRLDGNWADKHGYIAIPGLMSFRRSLNPGALFGLGKGLTPIFIAASLLALGFVLFLFVNSGRNRRSLHVALGLVLAGALGNLYDRAFVMADVVKYTANGRRYTEVGKIVSPPGEMPIKLGSWPEGRYVRQIPASAEPEVRTQGVVRDFIKMEPHFEVAGYKVDMWPWVFNIADVLLVWGVGLLMLNFWWERKAEIAQSAAPALAAEESGSS